MNASESAKLTLDPFFKYLSETIVLDPRPANPTIDRTFLIDIRDPSPNGVDARMKYFQRALTTDDEIMGHFYATGGWCAVNEPLVPIPPPAHTADPYLNKIKTRIDLDVSERGFQDYVLIAFRVHDPHEFIYYQDLPNFAITGGLWAKDRAKEHLFGPKWVRGSQNQNGHDVVSVLACAKPGISYKTQFNLGILMKDSKDEYYTPIIFDPKIEDSGG